MSAFFEQYYAARGVRIVKQARVGAIEGKGTVQAVLLGNREKLLLRFCGCWRGRDSSHGTFGEDWHQQSMTALS